MRNDDEHDELQAHLAASIEVLAESLLGKSNKASSRREMRFGKKGSISVVLQGPRRGEWNSFEAHCGGGPLKLVMHVRHLSYAAAVAWARDWLGFSVEKQRAYMGPQPAAEFLAKLARSDAAGPFVDGDERLRLARGIWVASGPLDGTRAETYLVGQRAIPRPVGGWPEAVRSYPGIGDLIVAATDASGEIMAVQRVRLTAEGSKMSAAQAERLSPPEAKFTNGITAGAAVRLPALAQGLPLLLAEGPETGLSVWTATGCETWIALGSISKLSPVAGRRIVVCRDDDVNYSPADRSVRQTIKGWRIAGMDVTGVFPWPIRRYDKSDFNDVIKEEGPEAVRAVIEAAMRPPTSTARPKEQIAHVRQSLGIATCALAAIATEIPPKHWIEPLAIGARIDVGVGKSVIARAATAEMLALLRVRDDNRTVAISVPTHNLGEEASRAFNALPRAQQAGLQAAVWRGREAEDPHAPGEAMCRNPSAIRAAMSAGVSVQSAACKRSVQGLADFKCPLFDQCAYQRQRTMRPDLWFVAHQMLFLEKDEAIGNLAAVVVDESFWQAGLDGTGAERITLALDVLHGDATIPEDSAATGRLSFLRRRVCAVLRDQGIGPVTRAAIMGTGLTAATAEEAGGLEWRRRIDPGLYPGMPEREQASAAMRGASNLDIRKLDMFWKAMGALLADGGPEASGWARVDEVPTDHGTVRALVLKGRRPVRAGWKVPTLLIDANFNPDLARPFFPFLLPLVDLATETPHMTVQQVVDQAYSKRHFAMTGTKDEAEARRGERNLREAAAILDREIASKGGKSLIITNKDLKEALPGAWMIPPNVEMAHYNAVAGLDGWGDVRTLVTVGSTNPPPAAVEELAEALTGQHIEPLPGWYDPATVTRETTDGPVPTEAERHPHPIAEAIRWQIREGGVIQAIGRARGVNRTAANPVAVLVMGDAVLPFAVEAVSADALAPSPVDQMLAAGGVAPEGPTHAANCYPALWPSAEAAKKAFKRDEDQRSGTFPDKEYSIRECPPPLLTKLTYQLAGLGKKPAKALVDLSRVPDPQAWLTDRLGALAWLTVEGDGPAQAA